MQNKYSKFNEVSKSSVVEGMLTGKDRAEARGIKSASVTREY